MSEQRQVDEVLRALQERAKELNCLYRVDELLRDDERPLEGLLKAVADALPPGWQFPASCVARVRLRDLEARG
jgi:hypothetical protein